MELAAVLVALLIGSAALAGLIGGLGFLFSYPGLTRRMTALEARVYGSPGGACLEPPAPTVERPVAAPEVEATLAPALAAGPPEPEGDVAVTAARVASPEHVEPEDAGPQPAAVLSGRSRATSPDMSDAERVIGTRLLAWCGAVILVLGIGYFLKYAYDAGWIGPSGRLALGAAAGTLAVVGARTSRFRGTDGWAQVVTGVGIAIYYACVYYAFDIYGIWGHGTAFAAAAAVTLLALFLAIRDDAVSIAALGLIGGFISPVVLSGGENKAWELFSYIAILDVIALGAAAVRRWRVLDLVAVAGTSALWFMWAQTWFDESQVLVGALSVGVFWSLFIGLAIIRGIALREPVRPETILTGAAACGFAFLAWELVFETRLWVLVTVCLATGAILAAWRRAIMKQIPDPGIGAPALLAQAGAAVIVAVGFGAGLHAVALVGAVQGVVLAASSRAWRTVHGEKSLSFGALGAACGAAHAMSVAGVFATLPMHANPDFLPVLNAPFASWLLAGAACCASGWFLRSGAEDDNPVSTLLVLTGAAVVLVAGHLEIVESLSAATAPRRFEFVSLAAFWSLAIVGFSLVARVTRNRAYVFAASGASLVAAAILLERAVGYPRIEELLFLNPKTLAPILFAAALAYQARVCAAALGADRGVRAATTLASLASAATVLLTLTWDLHAYFELRDMADARLQRCLLLLWSLAALVTNRIAVRAGRTDFRVLGVTLRLAAFGIAVPYVIRWSANDALFFDFQSLVLLLLAISVYLEKHGRVLRGVFSALAQACLFFGIVREIETWSAASSATLAFVGEVTPELGSGLVSAAWALQAFVLVALGLVRKRRDLRITGFVIFAVAIAKILFVDLESLEQVYRILSFIGTGALLLAGSFLYHSVGKSLEERTAAN